MGDTQGKGYNINSIDVESNSNTNEKRKAYMRKEKKLSGYIVKVSWEQNPHVLWFKKIQMAQRKEEERGEKMVNLILFIFNIV